MALGFTQCASKPGAKPAQPTNIVVSVAEQKLAIYKKDGKRGNVYPVSTSKFGLGDKPGTNQTPLGLHEVVAKIGHGAPSGSVFKSRRPTGQIIAPNSHGYDPIVSRIMWLRGLESQNARAYSRCIYIHGTADEGNIGRAVSYGCVRMKSTDVINLFQLSSIGSRVLIVEGKLPATVDIPSAVGPAAKPSSAPPILINPEQQQQPPIPPVQPVIPQPQRRPMEQVILAQNDAPQPTAAAGFQRRQLANGATVIYMPPDGQTSAPIVLKSRRSAANLR